MGLTKKGDGAAGFGGRWESSSIHSVSPFACAVPYAWHVTSDSLVRPVRLSLNPDSVLAQHCCRLLMSLGGDPNQGLSQVAVRKVSSGLGRRERLRKGGTSRAILGISEASTAWA